MRVLLLSYPRVVVVVIIPQFRDDDLFPPLTTLEPLNRKQRAFPSLFVVSFPLVVVGDKGRGGGYQRVVAIGFPMILLLLLFVVVLRSKSSSMAFSFFKVLLEDTNTKNEAKTTIFSLKRDEYIQKFTVGVGGGRGKRMVLNNNINSITTNSRKRRNSKRTRRLTRKRRNWRLIRCISPFADFLFRATSSRRRGRRCTHP